MSEDIGIPVEFPSPLPWLPPTCKPFTDKTAYDKLESFEKGLSTKTKKAEREIEDMQKDLDDIKKTLHKILIKK